MGNNIDALQLLKQCEKELLDCGATPLGQTHAKKIISRFKSQIAAFEIPELAPKMERAFLQVLGLHTLAWDDKARERSRDGARGSFASARYIVREMNNV